MMDFPVVAYRTLTLTIDKGEGLQIMDSFTPIALSQNRILPATATRRTATTTSATTSTSGMATTSTISAFDVTGEYDWNNTYNDTGGTVPEYYKNAQIGFLVLLFILIVFGNVVVLAAVAVNKDRRRSRMNFFILNLAICDLLTGPLVVLSDLITKFTLYWYAGDTFCRVHKFAQVIVMYASTYMLVALSIDRLEAVARPLQFNGTWLRVRLLVATAWTLSILFAIPELALFSVQEAHGGPMCVLQLSTRFAWQVYLTLIAVSLFFIPALIILMCYLAIIVVIFNSSIPNTDIDGKKKRKTDNFSRSEHRTQSSRSTGGIIPQAKIRTIKMTFLIVVVFILCWSPYFIFNLCQVFEKLPDSSEWAKITTFVQSLAPLNSAANPVIYGVFSTRICSYLGRSRRVKKTPRNGKKFFCSDSPQSRGSAADYTSISETEDFRLTGEVRSLHETSNGRIPLVEQHLTEEDRALLHMHVKANLGSHAV